MSTYLNFQRIVTHFLLIGIVFIALHFGLHIPVLNLFLFWNGFVVGGACACGGGAVAGLVSASRLRPRAVRGSTPAMIPADQCYVGW